MNQRERVRRAIEFKGPDRVPVLFLNRDQKRGDILLYNMALEDGERSEWGCKMRSLGDGTMGQPEAPVMPSWRMFEDFHAPMLRREKRMAGVEQFIKESEGYYRLAGLGISGFNLYTFIRGFANAMTDFVEERGFAEMLLDMIMGFETELIAMAAEHGFDGVHLADDWGSQENLLIAPELWRDLFKPRYEEQVLHAHNLGLHLWFHSCGRIQEIVDDLYDIGVDVINISQPNANDLEQAGGQFRGRQCFMEPISYQTVSITGTPEQIRAEAQRLYRLLGGLEGGFIGYVEDYTCMGMSEANYQACACAFERLGIIE